MRSLRDKFRGCLLGAAVGDVAGAVVEAESAGYIAATYRSVEGMLAAASVPEFTGPDWRVGRFTDDTQMTICVAEWLLAGEAAAAERCWRGLPRLRAVAARTARGRRDLPRTPPPVQWRSLPR